MATIKDRIKKMERAITHNKKMRPIPFYVLPPIGGPLRANIQSEINKRKGQRIITYEIVG